MKDFWVAHWLHCPPEREFVNGRRVILKHLAAAYPKAAWSVIAILVRLARRMGFGFLPEAAGAVPTPWGGLSAHPELDRRLRPGEIRAAQAYMENLGRRGAGGGPAPGGRTGPPKGCTGSSGRRAPPPARTPGPPSPSPPWPGPPGRGG